MRLTVLRHALAIDRADWDGHDFERPLTRAGERQARRVLRALAGVIRADEILTSPWRRARQTADIAAEVLDLPLREVPWLAGDVGETERVCLELVGHGDVLLVGHEPCLGTLVGYLMGGVAVPLKKSGVAWLSGDLAPAGMVLRGLLTPKLVSRIA